MSATVSDRVSNARLRKAYEERCAKGLLAPSLVAIRLGWYGGIAKGTKNHPKPNGTYRKPDGGRVERRLGLRPETSGGGRTWWTREIPREEALAICHAMGLDPVDLTADEFKGLPGLL